MDFFFRLVPSIDGDKKDLCTFLCKLPTQVEIRHRGVLLISPYFLTGEFTHSNPLDFKGAKKGDCIVVDFSLKGLGKLPPNNGSECKS